MTDITIEKLQAEGKVETPDPILNIAMGDKPLPLGQHSFELSVTDSAGNESAAAIVTIFILDQEAPTAILEAFTTDGKPSTNFNFGESFTLNASKSTDAGGSQIDRYIWRLVSGDEA